MKLYNAKRKLYNANKLLYINLKKKKNIATNVDPMCCTHDYIIVNENMLFKSKNGSLFEYVC